MSVYLLATTFVTAVLIPPAEFQEGGQASGRALAFLAHQYLGDGFGTVYDISSILILWFAGASAMAGLINIVPRYLPGYGMAPEWGRAVRPVVLVYTALAVRHHHPVQGRRQRPGGRVRHRDPGHDGLGRVRGDRGRPAPAPAPRRRSGSALVTLVLLYALVDNVIEKPDGIAISAGFILGIGVVSLVSRVWRSTELRAERIEFDDTARTLIAEAIASGGLHVIANKRQAGDARRVRPQGAGAARHQPHPADAHVLFLEITVQDPSDFSRVLARARGSTSTASASCGPQPGRAQRPGRRAAVLLDQTGLRPHCYFQWAEGHPLATCCATCCSARATPPR